MGKGKTYLVEFRILAAGSNQPSPVLQSSFDLGSRQLHAQGDLSWLSSSSIDAGPRSASVKPCG